MPPPIANTVTRRPVTATRIGEEIVITASPPRVAAIPVANTPIATSVGMNGAYAANRSAQDVTNIQRRLYHMGYLNREDVGRPVDGAMAIDETIAAIRLFQADMIASGQISATVFTGGRPDGRIDPGKATFRAMERMRLSGFRSPHEVRRPLGGIHQPPNESAPDSAGRAPQARPEPNAPRAGNPAPSSAAPFVFPESENAPENWLGMRHEREALGFGHADNREAIAEIEAQIGHLRDSGRTDAGTQTQIRELEGRRTALNASHGQRIDEGIMGGVRAWGEGRYGEAIGEIASGGIQTLTAAPLFLVDGMVRGPASLRDYARRELAGATEMSGLKRAGLQLALVAGTALDYITNFRDHAWNPTTWVFALAFGAAWAVSQIGRLAGAALEAICEGVEWVVRMIADAVSHKKETGRQADTAKSSDQASAEELARMRAENERLRRELEAARRRGARTNPPVIHEAPIH